MPVGGRAAPEVAPLREAPTSSWARACSISSCVPSTPGRCGPPPRGVSCRQRMLSVQLTLVTNYSRLKNISLRLCGRRQHGGSGRLLRGARSLLARRAPFPHAPAAASFFPRPAPPARSCWGCSRPRPRPRSALRTTTSRKFATRTSPARWAATSACCSTARTRRSKTTRRAPRPAYAEAARGPGERPAPPARHRRSVAASQHRSLRGAPRCG